MFGRLPFSSVVSGTERPPGPTGLPVLGCLFAARRDPLGFALAMTRRYGDLAYYRIGTYTGYFANHPDYVRRVLQSNHRSYSKDNHNYQKLKPVIGEGLITSSGEQWRRERRLVQPAFHRRHTARIGTLTSEAAVERLPDWDAAARRGEPIDFAAEMMHLTLRIIAEALFSTDIRVDAGTVGPAFAKLNEDISYRFRTVFVPPRWVPTRRNRTFKRARAALDAVVYAIIERRRQGGGQQTDLLARLLKARSDASGGGMTDDQVRDEVMTLLLAGHETTAALLTWTAHLLSTHPAAARRLRAELDDVIGGRVPTATDLPELSYTKYVLQESMRLYPPVWIVSRTAIDEDEIGGYAIPAGSVVTLSPYTMHRHPYFWNSPSDFDPGRFAPGRAEERPRYAYLPFGGGPRLCIGRDLAMMEAQLILATIAQRYVLEPVQPQTVEPEPLVTLRPRGGLNVVLRRRSE